MAEPKNYTRIPSLDSIIICGQCGALFLDFGWSNETHLAWHAEQGRKHWNEGYRQGLRDAEGDDPGFISKPAYDLGTVPASSKASSGGAM